MAAEFTSEQRQDFVDLLSTGSGMGFVSLHHNLAAHRTWPEWKRLIGGKYIFGESEIIDRQQFRRTVTSGIESPIDLNLQVADSDHEIMRGISDFEVADELYNNIFLDSNLHVLLTTDHPDGDRRLEHNGGHNPAMAWAKTYGASRVFYQRLGHHPHRVGRPQLPQDDVAGPALGGLRFEEGFL